MKKNGWGRIINMGSQRAINVMPLAVPTVQARPAVHSLTQAIAIENCNALVPGIIDTPANRNNMPEAAHYSWVTLEGLAQNIEKILQSNTNGLLLEI